MLQEQGHARLAPPMEWSEAAQRRIAAERARRYAAELVAEAAACRRRADELQQQVDARRLRGAGVREAGAQKAAPEAS